jgi:hypothetical protein
VARDRGGDVYPKEPFKSELVLLTALPGHKSLLQWVKAHYRAFQLSSDSGHTVYSKLMNSDYFLLLYSAAYGSLWSDKIRAIQFDIEHRNWRRLEYQRMHNFYNLGGNGCVLEDPSILCLALLNYHKSKRHLAHVKIDPLGTYSNILSRSHVDFADEHIISEHKVRSVNRTFKVGLGPSNCCVPVTSLPALLDSPAHNSKAAHLPNQPTAEDAEITQHHYGRFQDSLILLLGLYMISTYPKEDYELDRLVIPRHRSSFSRGELTLNGDEASTFFLNIFRKKVFYGIARAPAVPHYIHRGLDYAFNCWLKFEACSIDSFVCDLISRVSHCICVAERDKWFQYQYQQWESMYTLWRDTMRANLQQGKLMQDPSELHSHFILNLSTLNSSLSLVTSIIGIDLISLGPLFKDHHDGHYKQVYLCPPYAMPTEEIYNFGALMFARLYRYLLSVYKIDFSQIRMLGPTLQEILPNGYQQSFCEQQCNDADRLEAYLTEHRNAKGEPEGDCGYSSLYRVVLPVEYWKMVNYYTAARRDSLIY